MNSTDTPTRYGTFVSKITQSGDAKVLHDVVSFEFGDDFYRRIRNVIPSCYLVDFLLAFELEVVYCEKYGDPFREYSDIQDDPFENPFNAWIQFKRHAGSSRDPNGFTVEVVRFRAVIHTLVHTYVSRYRKAYMNYRQSFCVHRVEAVDGLRK